ncbi:lysosomal alpha-mannosidase isoform X1 [Phlebotomus papatasi]|uniref:lysosomal alpha-mannosidase isoform X1 n=1 Tax=Phlebotomus papatasi TaxID=29031 RepID=UPI0024840595|nr:lysosomal alpha-mannosidase isoform X1 [Phlebotomus papatasi]
MKLLLVLLCFVAVILSGCEARPKAHRRDRILSRSHIHARKAPTCGYESCPKLDPNRINVHIVPHTHDDVGWLKTVDQYYYGSQTLIQKAGVQYILDSVIQALLADPNRRFIYVESAFFFKWWNEQTNDLQEKVRQLVEEGRLEFIGGAWSMNDEAVVHYQSVIDQFTYGLRRLNDTFGKCARPRVGWQIDPFGHTREQASLFAQMGFDGMFFGRLDYQDKTTRLNKREAEMIWRGSANLGEVSDLFTGVLFNNYGPPPGFCFDILCADEPMIDDRRSRDYNIDRRLRTFFEYIERQSMNYRTNNVITTFGGDFTYMDANVYFKNLDKLIRYANEAQQNGSNFNLVYSTPSCYLKALHDAHITWPTKTDDFIPYASDPHAFWTGYYTSKPALKRLERMGNNFFQICKQLTSLAPEKEDKSLRSHLDYMSEVMGVLQHHDAITGTSKEHVTQDYTVQITAALKACSYSAKIILNQLTKRQTNKDKPVVTEPPQPSARYHDQATQPQPTFTFDFDSCLLLNVSACDISETKDKFMVTVYNALAHSVFHYIRVPVDGNFEYEVTDYRSVPITHQIISVPPQVTALHPIQASGYELVFLATELPPVGYKSFFITRKPARHVNAPRFRFKDVPEVVLMQNDEKMASDDTQRPPWNSNVVSIGNKYFSIGFDSKGFLNSIALDDGSEHKLSQTFFYYEGAVGDNRVFKNRSSGAYIFRPNSTERFVANQVQTKVIKGPVVEEVHQTFNDWISQVIRVYHDYNFVEFEWLVGPIPVDDNVGKEVVSRFMTDIKSSNVFYTDSNGREMIRRVRDHRETWNLNLEEQVAGNYYPVTTNIAVEDQERRLSVMTDRAQGGSSLQDGAVELMVHRRLLHDDAFGVAEALNHTHAIRGKHFLIFGKLNGAVPTMAARERFLQAEKLLSPWLFFSDVSSYEYEDWRKTYSHLYSGVALSLPQNVKLLTLEPWKDLSFLMRFEHILEQNDDPEYSKSVTFNFKDVFGSIFDINHLEEMTLDGNQLLEESLQNRFKFKPEYNGFTFTNEIVKRKRETATENPNVKGVTIIDEGTPSDDPVKELPDDSAKWDITLEPMQIRTFILFVNPSIYDK